MSDLLRVSLVGAQPSGEEWSVNPVWSIGGDFGTPVTPAQAQTIATAIANVAVPVALTNAWATGTTFTGCRVEARSVSGVLETQAEGIRATPVPGTGSSGHPYQVSLVTSLRTAQPGASGRGRLFWPGTGMSVSGGTLRPTVATVNSIQGGVKTFLSSIQAAIDVTLDGVALGVWSRKLGNVFVVTSLQMGDVADVQRRRRDALIETISTVAYP